MPHLFPWLRVLPLALLLFAAGVAPATAVESYEACLKLIGKNADHALDEAQGWSAMGGGVPARHCAALALKQLGHYVEAATALEALAVERGAGDERARAEILSEAGNCWILQHEGQRAYDALSRALGLFPGDRDLLIDRARAAAVAEDYRAASEDLDKIIAKAPLQFDAEALVLRANARRLQGNLAGAKADAEAVIAKAPGAADAWLERGIDRYFLDDKAGAHEDWRRVLKIAPDSKAALDAQLLLEKDALGESGGAKPKVE